MHTTQQLSGKLFATALILFSAHTKADCRAFAGAYLCVQVEDDEQFTAHVAFTNENKLALSDGENQDVLNWDSWTPLADSDGLSAREGLARCESAGRLVTAFRAIDIDRHGKRTGELRWESHWRRQDEVVIVTTEGEVVLDQGQSFPFVGEFHCMLKPL